MIQVNKLYKNGEGSDPVLVYDAEAEELWGYPEIWESHLAMVGLSEEDFASFFDGPRLWAGEVDEDPFEDIPNAEDLCRNYPPGSEEIPDYPTPEPAARRLEEESVESKAARRAAEAFRQAGGGNTQGN